MTTTSMDFVVAGHSSGSVQQSAATPPSISVDFDHVYETHVDFVWRAVRHLGVPSAHLDDAVQEVFVVVHRRLRGFEGRSSLRTWIFGIAVGIARNVRRAGRRQGHLEPIETWTETFLAPERPDEAAANRDLVCEALDRLADEQREVLVLADVEELTAPEIVDVLEIPLGTVYSRLRVARRDFAVAVRALEGEGGAR